MKTLNLSDKLKHHVFKVAAQICKENHVEAYVIGGFVRELLLERPSKDIDIVVVGDGEKLFVRIAHFIGEARSQGWSRFNILKELATWTGIYVPSFYETEIDDKTELEVVTGVKAEYKDLGIPEKVQRFFIDSLNYLVNLSSIANLFFILI